MCNISVFDMWPLHTDEFQHVQDDGLGAWADNRQNFEILTQGVNYFFVKSIILYI